MSKTYEKKAAAERYDFARALPGETVVLWMDNLRQIVPPGSVRQVLDLGSGTGRFARPLRNTYNCPIIAIDPSGEMLNQGENLGLEGISWICGSAEGIPLADGSVDMVWLSQVFHHFEDAASSLKEIYRVLSPGGFLVVRNGTRESDAEMEWIKHFPEAREYDKGRIPSQAHIINNAVRNGFQTVEVRPISQLFAASCQEYYEKIRQRGLSSLISISDEAFISGLRSLRGWADRQPSDRPIYEKVDLFGFRKIS